jgi:hypothetical protein
MQTGQKIYSGHHIGNKTHGYKFHGNKFHSGNKSGLPVLASSSDGNIYNSSNSQEVMKEPTGLVHHSFNKKKSYLQIEKKVRKRSGSKDDNYA